jgi:thiol-disulfide isomerase/thioredoxin
LPGSAAMAAQEAAQVQAYDVQKWPSAQVPPPLEGTDLNGKVWRLADLRGRAVLLNFWAGWCEPCRAEMPSLQAMAEREGPQRLLVLAINFKESTPAVQRFVAQTQLTLPVLQDPLGTTARQWGIRIYPSTVLIGADGRVRSVVRGELDWTGAEALKLIQPLLPR